MPELIAGLAQLLADAQVADWHPDGTAYTGTRPGIYDTVVPPEPDAIVVLSLYPGEDPNGEDSRNGWSTPRLQVRTRAGTDPRQARDLDWQVHVVLHGIGPLQLPDGTELTDCYSLQSGPLSMGQDATGRWEYTRNYQLTTD